MEVEHYYKEHGNSMPVMDLETLAAQGDPFAQCFLAEKYYYGVMTETNWQENLLKNQQNKDMLRGKLYMLAIY